MRRAPGLHPHDPAVVLVAAYGEAVLEELVQSRAERGRGMAIGRDRQGQQAGPSNQSVTAPPPPSSA